MFYLLCKHEVEDFSKWRRVFESHADAHREAGLKLLHLFRDTVNPNLVVILFRVDDLNKAHAFTEAPEAHEAGQTSGVIGVAEISYLSE